MQQTDRLQQKTFRRDALLQYADDTAAHFHKGIHKESVARLLSSHAIPIGEQ